MRAFTKGVAHDITQEGPAAWRRHFADSPSFFMASEGHLVFPNSAAATAGIQDVARSIKQIELRWGDELRADPLTPHLAVVATSYHEVRVSTDGSAWMKRASSRALPNYEKAVGNSGTPIGRLPGLRPLSVSVEWCWKSFYLLN